MFLNSVLSFWLQTEKQEIQALSCEIKEKTAKADTLTKDLRVTQVCLITVHLKTGPRLKFLVFLSHNTTNCKLALITVTFLTCCFTFQNRRSLMVAADNVALEFLA